MAVVGFLVKKEKNKGQREGKFPLFFYLKRCQNLPTWFAPGEVGLVAIKYAH